MPKSRGILPPRVFWTAEQEAHLRANYADTPTVDLAAQYGRPVARVQAKAHAMGLHKSRELIAQIARERSNAPDHPGQAFRFQKGLAPANKGVKHAKGWAPGRMAESQFKAGNKPHTWVPVGTARVNPDGVLEIKVNDEPGPKSRRWRNYAMVVWETQVAPVPSGHIVVFKPGKKTTDPALITPDRLECISRAENIRRNAYYTALPPELARIVQLRGVLTRTINRITKEQNAQDH